MKIVVTGSLGHISRPLTQELIQQGHKVTVVSSKAERKSEIEVLGAKAAIGTMEDVDFLSSTFQGADIVYAMEALHAGSFHNHDLDFVAANTKLGSNYKRAIEQSGVKRVVHLSSIGAHMANGNGILAFHYHVENILRQLPDDVSIKFMRPVGFYYNMFAFIPVIKTQGAIIQNYGGDEKEPWVSPLDIARVIAEEMEKPFDGREIRYIASDEVSPNEVAAILGEAIGKPDLKWKAISDEQFLNGLLSTGMNPKTAKGLTEMNASRRGGVLYEDYYRNQPALGHVKLKDFAKDFAKVYNAYLTTTYTHLRWVRGLTLIASATMTNTKPYRIKTISEFHKLRGVPKPLHPLVSVVDYASIEHSNKNNLTSWVLDFYSISLKRTTNAKMRYGQQEYDFDEGVLFFMAPGQVFNVVIDTSLPSKHTGWLLLVHPDFLWNTSLARKIKGYDFFDYSVNEALFLSEKEEVTITHIVKSIEQEYQANIDKFSQNVIIAQLELLLTYAERYYQRQFITRKISSHQLLDKLEKLLNDYFNDPDLVSRGLPTVQYIADTLNVSPSYLSGLLKVLTGQSTQQHIHDKLIEKAKEKLSTTGLSVSEIAYELGFEHSQSFSKLFKAKTSLSPLEFRQLFN